MKIARTSKTMGLLAQGQSHGANLNFSPFTTIQNLSSLISQLWLMIQGWNTKFMNILTLECAYEV